MDCVPRLRQPTPPKKNAREELDKDESDFECKRCHKYQDKLKELEDENFEVKQELEKLRNDMNKMRLLAKATSQKNASKNH